MDWGPMVHDDDDGRDQHPAGLHPGTQDGSRRVRRSRQRYQSRLLTSPRRQLTHQEHWYGTTWTEVWWYTCRDRHLAGLHPGIQGGSRRARHSRQRYQSRVLTSPRRQLTHQERWYGTTWTEVRWYTCRDQHPAGLHLGTPDGSRRVRHSRQRYRLWRRKNGGWQFRFIIIGFMFYCQTLYHSILDIHSSEWGCQRLPKLVPQGKGKGGLSPPHFFENQKFNSIWI